MIRFFVGKADLDVSGRIRSAIAELLRGDAQGRRIIFIVPEQFEYETERAVYKLLKQDGLLHRMSAVEITTFTALSSEILSENGVDRPRADDIVKSVLMHKAAADCRSGLTSLSGIVDKAGFCEKMTATVTGFKSMGLSSRDLELSVEKMRQSSDIAVRNFAVFKKIEDVSLLYTCYDALMEKNGYLDGSDVIGIAAGLVSRSSKFDGADVFVDSFNDFTNHQLRFLCEMIPAAKSVAFGFVTDADDDKNEVFKTANSHITRLKAKADSENIEAKIETDGMRQRYAKDTAPGDLPQMLFQGGKSSRDIGGACEIIAASEIFEELDFVCSKIKQLADRGMRYRDIAVLCTDLGTCGRYIESAFNKYELPFFLDMRESILGQPLINAVIALLNALRDFSADTVLSCVKTGFFTKFDKEKNERVGLSDYDANVFEDYIFEWALGTENLKRPFTFRNERLENDNRMTAAEEIRKSVAEPLRKFSEKLPHGRSVIDGARLTEMIYDYLINTVNIRKALFAKCVDPEENAMDGDRTALYQRLWDTLMNIFNTLHSELNGVELTLDEYYRLFRDICSGTTLASPPQNVDRVLVGDIDRTRADNVKAAFIVGASFDLFPTPAAQTGIFSQYETEILRENITHTNSDQQTELCLKSAKEQYSLSLYRAYKAVCLPTEYLCLSFSENDPSGEAMQISAVSEEISEMFPDLAVRRASEFGDEFYCRSINAAKLRFALSVNSGTRENAILREALRKSGGAEFVDHIEELRNERTDVSAGEHKISADAAALLFPTQVGATAVENMSKCKFNFFCESGLGIAQRTQRNFNSSRRGDAIHFVLENILRKFSANSADMSKFCTLSRRGFFSLSRKFLEEYCRLETNNTFFDDARSRFLFNNVANSAADVLITMQTEFCSRRYRPKFFELDLRGGEPKYVIDNDSPISSVPPQAVLFAEDGGDGEIPATDAASPSQRVIMTAPLRIPLNGGGYLTVSGRIDRVDMFTENTDSGEKIYVRAVDYKSSVRTFDINNARSGINIQMLLYLSALLDANRGNPSVDLKAGGISYVPSNSSGAQKSEMDPFKLLALSHRPSGLLVLDEVTEKEYKGYADSIIGKIIEDDNKAQLLNADDNSLTAEQRREREEYRNELDNLKALFEPNEQNSLSADEFEGFLNEVRSAVGERYSALLNGDVSALPLEYTENIVKLGRTESEKRLACTFCRFGSVCKNAGKNTLCVADDSKKDSNKGTKKDTKKSGGKSA